MPYGNSGSEASVPQYRSLRTTTATVVATNTDPVLVDAGLLLAGQDKHQKCLFLISELRLAHLTLYKSDISTIYPLQQLYHLSICIACYSLCLYIESANK